MEKTKAPRGAKPLPTPISKHELESLPIPKTREDLLKRIAERGFEVGYAANLNFATHDIADKVHQLEMKHYPAVIEQVIRGNLI